MKFIFYTKFYMFISSTVAILAQDKMQGAGKPARSHFGSRQKTRCR